MCSSPATAMCEYSAVTNSMNRSVIILKDESVAVTASKEFNNQIAWSRFSILYTLNDKECSLRLCYAWLTAMRSSRPLVFFGRPLVWKLVFSRSSESVSIIDWQLTVTVHNICSMQLSTSGLEHANGSLRLGLRYLNHYSNNGNCLWNCHSQHFTRWHWKLNKPGCHKS